MPVHRLITKPEQSGKTFIMLREMISIVEGELEGDQKNINVVFCDNNLMLVLQTLERVGGFPSLEKYLELSSSKRTSHHKFQQVVDSIVNDEIRNILCCSNHTRMKDLGFIISSLFDLGISENYQFNIWVDEADKWLHGLDRHVSPIMETHSNIRINLITATPNRILQWYKTVEVVPLEKAVTDQYHSWKDCEAKLYPPIFSTLEFVFKVLTDHSREIIPGSKWFIPGCAVKESHDVISEFCRNKGMVTIIINGDGFKVVMPNGEVIRKEKSMMPDLLISSVYDELELERYPVAITGYFCISRGITISSERFQITHAIMPAGMRNKQEISQIGGRLKGNQKGWHFYQKPKVYATETFYDTAALLEAKTIGLSETAFRTGKKIIGIDDYQSADKKFYYYQNPEEFTTYESAVRYLETQEDQLKPRNHPKQVVNAEKMIRDMKWIGRRGGFVEAHLVSSALNTKKSVLEGIAPIFTREMLNIPIFKTVAEPDNLKYRSFVIIPVYESETSHPDDVRFIVRHTKWK